MADYNGFYFNGYWQESDFMLSGVYMYPSGFKSSQWNSRLNNLMLYSGGTYELEFSSNLTGNKFSVDVYASYIGVAKLEMIENGIITDYVVNTTAGQWERLSVTSRGKEFKVRISVGKGIYNNCVSKFNNFNIQVGSSIYNFENLLDVILDETVLGSTLWVKINGEWKVARVKNI